MDEGNTNDLLKGYLNRLPGWKKVFGEPIPPLYGKLRNSVKQWPNSTAINVAISADESVSEDKVDMFCLKESFDEDAAKRVPQWANQICSFNPNPHFPGKDPAGVPFSSGERHLVLSSNSPPMYSVLF